MNVELIEEIQARQKVVLDAIYAELGKDEERDAELLVKLDAQYQGLVAEIQEAHPLKENCPAYICDGDLYQFYSDFHKEVYGCRYRGNMPVKELREALERLHAQANGEAEAEQQRQKAAIERFEARITATISAGARDRATAIRWIAEAEDIPAHDTEHLCYRLGLPFGYFKEAA